MNTESAIAPGEELQKIKEALNELVLRQEEATKPKRLMTKDEAANYLAVSKRMLDKLVSLGEVPVTRVTSRRLFDRRALDAIIKSRTEYQRDPMRPSFKRVRK